MKWHIETNGACAWSPKAPMALSASALSREALNRTRNSCLKAAPAGGHNIVINNLLSFSALLQQIIRIVRASSSFIQAAIDTIQITITHIMVSLVEVDRCTIDFNNQFDTPVN